MRCLLRQKCFVHALELSSNPVDLLPRRCALLVIQLHCLRARQAPLRAIHNRSYHVQIADQFGAGSRRGFLLGLALRFEKQRGIIQNALAHCGRSPAPGGIQSAGFASITMMLSEYDRHALAILQALPGCRRQKLHRRLRRDLALAHLLLDDLRQQFH
jgi:hypothetical protein